MSIGNEAFSDCYNLTNVTIGNSVTNIGTAAFNDCTSLAAIAVDPLNLSYSSLGGVLFNKSQTALIQYPTARAGPYTIPATVTNIADNAFRGCHSLTSVTIGYLLTTIGTDAFYSCTGLTNVTIPRSVTSIGSGAFAFCANLLGITVNPLNFFYTSVDGVVFDKTQTLLIICPAGKVGAYVLPNNVTTVGDSAFQGCSGLTSVTIGKLVTSIGGSAFYGCQNLISLYFKGNAPNFGGDLSQQNTGATAYYLPGAQGWGSTFGGLPTALWTPRVQTSDASFGAKTNQFGFNIIWSSGMPVVVEAATNLANPIWIPLQTNTLISGSAYFTDPQWTNHPSRFYRVHSR
jgi:hypothetical protein